jgi:hypothetical protein
LPATAPGSGTRGRRFAIVATGLQQCLLEAEGLTSQTSQGQRIHPALVELRQQRIALARLFAALHIPVGEQTDRTQHRGTRGVYGLRGVS